MASGSNKKNTEGNRPHDLCNDTAGYREKTVCPKCGALFADGRWSWDDIPEEVSHAVCPACRRIADNYPAGVIELSGSFFNTHRTEIMNLIINIKNLEIATHPLERFMEVEEQEDKTVITTTGIHLARRIGDALFNAFEGELNYNYSDENLVRIYWRR